MQSKYCSHNLSVYESFFSGNGLGRKKPKLWEKHVCNNTLIHFIHCIHTSNIVNVCLSRHSDEEGVVAASESPKSYDSTAW